MISSDLLMRRALRWSCDTSGVAVNNIKQLPAEALAQLQDLTETVAADMQYNQLKYFRPFEHQRSFFATAGSDRRGILAANRIGKTVSTCYETAMHLTGQYPDWWKGHRFDGAITAMVAGEGWSQDPDRA